MLFPPCHVALAAAALSLCFGPLAATATEKPNIIVIFTDDQGYGDLGCFGSESIKTPNIDQMAAEGLRLTSFYAQPVCGVSRAALMTGSYPIRIGEPGNVKRLHTELHNSEVTMAEVLRSAGYATALIGKWHLGNIMPNDQGFDYFFGTPKFNGYTVKVEDTNFRSSLFRNREVVVPAVENWDKITKNYTEEAIRWIEKNREVPFFLYLAHNMPHIPLGASEEFKGRSDYGPYGDAIEEIDWSCGQIFEKLKELGIDESTLVIYTSDNGPWVETTRGMMPDEKPFIPRDHSGTADPLRGWKMSAWDGGCRVPFVARWPSHIPAGKVNDEILATMDLLPTFAALSGGKLPDYQIDGKDAFAFLMGETEQSPRDDYFYYTGCLLTGVRQGNWKLVLPRPANPPGTGWWGRMIEAVNETQLFDLANDPGESTNVAAMHPNIVASLQERITQARTELGDIDQTGTGARFFDAGSRKLQNPIRAKSESTLSAVEPKYDGYPPAGNLRFNFESGSLEGWTITEGKLGTPVSPHPFLPRWKNKPFNQEGKFHLSTIASESGFSDKQTGSIDSPSFRIEGDRAAFLVSGGYDKTSLYVALIDSKTGEKLLDAGGNRSSQMQRIEWNVGPWKGKTVFLRIVDRNQNGWGHLTFDDFSVEGALQ